MDDQAVWRRGAPVRFPSARWELTFSRALRRENGGRLELALPYSPARPWPLPELFCFARAGGASAENPTSSTPLTEGRPQYFEKTENYVYHFTKDCATITMESCQNQRK